MSSDTENIQVVVRCRGRNAKETSTKSPIVVHVKNEESDQVLLNPSNESGVSAQLNSRIYNFDSVFGPMTDQSLLFRRVASPLFDEFLKGYNCTLLVYGMTSTGKTYTMTGDSELTKDDQLNEQAGIIPRILMKLFDALNNSEGEPIDDYIVKCSFIELYNEELKDLMSDDINKKLRIFDQKQQPQQQSGLLPDSSNKSSIYIQNLEEITLRNAKHGIHTLQKGLRLRQVAATKMNDVSSRSHTVFTLNLFKQNKDTGDLFRISKMNLVDLAGSENISRSGAINQRAKEAGSINQSLLTLGRVINLLVEKNQTHIPYRESKLTRLLQDSLGGRTKTCLIATISPAKINYDETLSTLEYANKAKSIQNKPQLGSTLSKDILLRDLTFELSKIKSDLMATKSRDGIYMDNDNYDEFMNDIQEYKAEIDESLRNNEVLNKKNESLKTRLNFVESQNNEYLTLINTLNATVESLHNKIDTQKQNEKNLMVSSSKFKEVIHNINSNMSNFKNFEKETKQVLRHVTESIIKEQSDKIFDQLKQISNEGDSKISDDVSKIKSEVNDIVLSLQDLTYKACKNVSDSIFSKFPTLFSSFNAELKSLQSVFLSLQTDLNVQYSQLSKENNDLKTILNDSLFNNHDEIIRSAVDLAREKIQSESDKSISQILKVLESSKQTQESIVSSYIETAIVDAMNSEKEVLKPVQEKWEESSRNIINKCDQTSINFTKTIDLNVLQMIKNLENNNEFTKNSEQVINSELNKINGLTKKFKNSTAIDTTLESIKRKFNMRDDEALSLVQMLKSSSSSLSKIENEITCKILHNNLPNLPDQDIMSMINELEKEQTEIKMALLPSGKTPKREALSIPKNPINNHNNSNSENRSPPKFHLIGQRFHSDDINNDFNKENLVTKRKLEGTETKTKLHKVPKLSKDGPGSRIPKRNRF